MRSRSWSGSRPAAGNLFVSGHGLGLVLIITLLLSSGLVSAPAQAFEGFVGTRALGMGGASRAAAASGTGPLLNPSGMSLLDTYNVEAAYHYLFTSAGHDQFFHGSIVDSTSAYKVAGGFYYTYHADDPNGVVSGHGHELGLALSFPFGERVSVGGTLKYFNLSGDEQAVGSNDNFTADAGITIRPTKGFSIGVVGTNLRNLHTGVAPVTLGYGLAVTAIPDVLFVLDGVTNFTTVASFAADPPPPERKATSVMGGGEVLLAKTVALRAGGGYDGVTQNGYFSAGLSGVSEAGALDVGVRQDAFREGSAPRETIAGVSVRLFVTQP
jgi:hypothetical protein